MNNKEVQAGDILYAIPKGNAARRWSFDEDGFTIFEVVKVNRKYTVLRRDGWKHTDNYCLESGATQAEINSGYGNNSGYYFFKSPEEYIEYREVTRIKKVIRESCGGYQLSSLISDECAVEVYKVLLKHKALPTEETTE